MHYYVGENTFNHDLNIFSFFFKRWRHEYSWHFLNIQVILLVLGVREVDVGGLRFFFAFGQNTVFRGRGKISDTITWYHQLYPCLQWGFLKNTTIPKTFLTNTAHSFFFFFFNNAKYLLWSFTLDLGRWSNY